MKPRHKRLVAVVVGVAALAVSAALVLNAFRSNLVFFFSPTEIAENKAPVGRTFRLGGLVENGSIKRAADGLTVNFIVTDTAKTIPVRYKGILPDLFKEGKGVVAQGQLGADGVFSAAEVFAKHDENYMAPEAAEAVDKARQARERAANSMAQSGAPSK